MLAARQVIETVATTMKCGKLVQTTCGDESTGKCPIAPSLKKNIPEAAEASRKRSISHYT
jgi:hypothetical protein